MKIILLAIILTSLLVAETFTIKPGWNLLGTIAKIPTAEVLANADIKNVVIYSNGSYKATNKNEFTTIPAKSGFFVFSESSTTLSLQTFDSSVEVVKIDENGNELSADATSWKILHIKVANLYIEMKDDYTVGQKFSNTDAVTYCTDLTIGSISGWRLPTNAEFTGIGSIYQNTNNYFVIIDADNSWHQTSNGYASLNSSAHSGTTSSAMPTICVKDVP